VSSQGPVAVPEVETEMKARKILIMAASLTFMLRAAFTVRSPGSTHMFN
jgi:hypothetical protein